MSDTPGHRPLWTMMPGWGIAADLTPPELINSRQLTVVRKFIFTCLVGLLVLCLAGFVFARRHESAAAAELETQQAVRVDLQREVSEYAGITKLQGTITEIQQQTATLMAGDVDLANLLGQLRNRLPAGMTITQASVIVSVVGAAGAAPGGGLDATGRPRIGNITITGSGRKLADLATYIDRLVGIGGVVDVVPVSNTASAGGTQFSLALGLTNTLLSHRFDVPAPGGN